MSGGTVREAPVLRPQIPRIAAGAFPFTGPVPTVPTTTTKQGAKVLLQVEPQGRQVECEAGENLLDVLLRAAVPVSYSCRSGRCGTCRCTVRPLAAGPADTAAEVLACQTVLQQDCTVEISEPDEVVVHPARVLKATVLRIDAPTHDIRVLTLRPNKPLSYTPGQYATLQFANGQARPYSMAGVPGDEALEFHIRIVPGGQASGHVAGVLQPGDSVRVSGPLGTSYWRSRHAGPVICVAGGTGWRRCCPCCAARCSPAMRHPSTCTSACARKPTCTARPSWPGWPRPIRPCGYMWWRPAARCGPATGAGW